MPGIAIRLNSLYETILSEAIAEPISERSEPISERSEPISERSEPISERSEPISERSEPFTTPSGTKDPLREQSRVEHRL